MNLYDPTKHPYTVRVTPAGAQAAEIQILYRGQDFIRWTGTLASQLAGFLGLSETGNRSESQQVACDKRCFQQMTIAASTIDMERDQLSARINAILDLPSIRQRAQTAEQFIPPGPWDIPVLSLIAPSGLSFA